MSGRVKMYYFREVLKYLFHSSLQKSSKVNSGHRAVSKTSGTAFGKSIYLYWFVLWMLDGDILIQFLISTTHAHQNTGRDRGAVHDLYISLLQQYDQPESNNSFSSTCLCGVICHYKSDEGNRSSWSGALLLSKTTFCESHLLVTAVIYYTEVLKIFFLSSTIHILFLLRLVIQRSSRTTTTLTFNPLLRAKLKREKNQHFSKRQMSKWLYKVAALVWKRKRRVG